MSDARRRRYERKKPEHASISPFAAAVLRVVGECGVTIPEQISRIAGVGSSGIGKHLRNLFDHGLVDRIPVPLATLMPESARRDPQLMFTLGPDAYRITQKGLDWLVQTLVVDESWKRRRIPDFLAGNTYFLAHELLCRDLRAWLALCERADGGKCSEWRYGPDAYTAEVRPDAAFRYLLPSGRAFTGYVEADRGTERGDRWWSGKVAAYSAMPSGEEIEYVLVVTLDAARRDRIAASAKGAGISPALFCCVREDLYEGGMARAIWMRPGWDSLSGLVPERLLLPTPLP